MIKCPTFLVNISQVQWERERDYSQINMSKQEGIEHILHFVCILQSSFRKKVASALSNSTKKMIFIQYNQGGVYISLDYICVKSYACLTSSSSIHVQLFAKCNPCCMAFCVMDL